MQKKNVIIYRESLLPYSETFIPAQAEKLTRFTPVYVGMQKVQGLALPADRMVLLNSAESTLNRIRLKLFGPSRGHLHALTPLSPALIHAHFGLDAVDMIAFAKKLRVPLFVTHHGWDVTFKNEVLRKKARTRFYLHRYAALTRAAQRILCVSDFIRSSAINRGAPEKKTVTHYIGVDVDAFVSDPAVKREQVVLFTGRLVEEKGCEYVIRAMPLVRRSAPDARLVIIGDGALRNRLEQLAASARIPCEFLGSQPQNVVRSWMNRAKVFCVPSVIASTGACEGFGIAFVEAQAMQTPVVSFAIGGIPEAVAHGQTGLLARHKDVEDLAGNIATLLTQEQMWLAFSEAARQRAVNRFDVTRQTRELEDIYMQVLDGYPETTCQETAGYAHAG